MTKVLSEKQTKSSNSYSPKSVFLTAAGLKDIQSEIKYLKETKLKEVAERLTQAREMGGNEENSEFDSAVEEHDLVEMRLGTLEDVLKNAKLIRNSHSSEVSIGSTVSLLMGQEKQQYTIVGKLEANPFKKLISNESPIGSALLGAHIGQEVEVQTPSSKYMCKVIEIS